MGGFDESTVMIGGVALIPLIIGVIQFVKRLFPEAPGNVWLALSFALGIAGQTVVFLIATGGSVVSWSLETWATAVVTGLAFGLAAGKSWDELKERGLLGGGQDGS